MTETATVAPEPPAGELITVELIPKAWEDLLAACEREGLSRTDVINRAISLYEFITAQRDGGRDILIRDHDKTMQLVRLL